MMAIGIVGALAGGVISAMGAMQSAQAQSAAAQQNAQIAAYNKSVADRNKTAALAEADTASNEQRQKSQRQLSSIRAAYGASGLALEGSPLAVMEDTAAEGELDAQKTAYKGKMTAVGYDDEAKNYQMKESLFNMEADSASRAGPISAIGALFGGVTKAASYGMGTTPGFSIG